ncbi:MAG: carbohydrate-binding family 9-like protein [Candidatus Solibacter usitatus]|nr:carbohydrate-binding family 9-like protein [Candidatus Solibacter usitatus]
MKLLPLLLTLLLPAAAQTPEVALSKRLKSDTALSTDPASPLWRGAPAVFSENNARGQQTPGHRSEFRSRWTKKYLYFLFICPYQELYLIANPVTAKETNKLWEHDAAEIFIGADFEKIWQYREYQVSPQGEWVDLDIDRKQPLPEGGWRWDSGFTVAARIDPAAKVWYGAMKIPIASITAKAVKPGFEFRVNYYRFQGPPPKRANIAWRPTGPTGNHHIPEAFGLLRLER